MAPAPLKICLVGAIFAAVGVRFTHSQAPCMCDANPFATAGYPRYFGLVREPSITCAPGHVHGVNYCNYRDENSFPASAEMSRRCQEFCGHSSIPVVVGSPNFGLSFRQAVSTLSGLADDRTADNFMNFNRTALRQCLEKRNSFRAIKQDSTEFVRLLKEFDVTVLAYQESVRSSLANIATALDSQATRDAIQAATGSAQKAAVISRLYTGILLNQGLEREIASKLSELNNETSQLHLSLHAQLSDANAFLSHCTSKLWPPTDGQLLLDMCTRSGTKCFNQRHAEHVSCGCLNDLAVDAGTGIADTSNVLPDAGHTGRRLLQSTAAFDVCAEASQRSSSYASTVLSNLQSRTQSNTLFRERRDQLVAQYSDFFCPSSWVDVNTGRRQLIVERATGPLIQRTPRRRQQQQQGCAVDPFGDHGYHSFLKLEKNLGARGQVEYCNYGQEIDFASTASMVERCERFCPADSIPVVIGSETFGLNFTSAAKVLGNLMGAGLEDGLQNFTTAQYKQCLSDRNAFHSIKTYGAAMIQKLYEFDAAVLNYRSATMTGIASVMEVIDSQATQDAIQAATGDAAKIRVIVGVYNQIMHSYQWTGAKNEMSQKLLGIKESVTQLKHQLDTEMSKAIRFSRTCTKRFFPPSTGKAMLDICTRTGTKCIDVAEAEHVSCGCLINLAVGVGRFHSVGDGGGGGISLSPPRPSIDVCAEARSQSNAYRQSMQRHLTQAGHYDLVTNVVDELQRRYGNFFCSPFLPLPPDPLSSAPTGSGAKSYLAWVFGGLGSVVCCIVLMFRRRLLKLVRQTSLCSKTCKTGFKDGDDDDDDDDDE
eukprot:COSAG01_NODE_3520_length_5979_cov_3.900170_1_plen_822_part_00